MVVILMAMGSWKILFDQSRLTEIDRTRFALKIALLNVDKAVAEIDSALSKAGEYSQGFGLALEEGNQARQRALEASFIEFSYQLGSQLKGFSHAALLDSELNILLKVSLQDLINFSPSDLLLSAPDTAAISNLHSYMRKNIVTQGISSFKSEQDLLILGAQVFSPYVPKGASLTWGNKHYMVAVFTSPFDASNEAMAKFDITPSGATSMLNISDGSYPVLRSYNTFEDVISANTALFKFQKLITRNDISARISSYLTAVISLSIVLIIILLVVVNYVVRRSVIKPILQLEK
jgi:hypothetical protein